MFNPVQTVIEPAATVSLSRLVWAYNLERRATSHAYGQVEYPETGMPATRFIASF